MDSKVKKTELSCKISLIDVDTGERAVSIMGLYIDILGNWLINTTLDDIVFISMPFLITQTDLI